MILFLKLLLAHFLGDFVFQPDSWIRNKEIKKHKSGRLYIHSLLHGALSLILVWDLCFWPYTIAISLSHYLIDLCKLTFQKTHNQKAWFFIDQALHLLILGLIVWLWTGTWFDFSMLDAKKTILTLTGIVFLTSPASVIIKILVSGWTPNTEDRRKDSLQNAGKYIGILERLFVLTFILSNHWQAIGFILAAKSIFRFGDLTASKERKLTEYVMIGTLLSFGMAVLTGLLIQSLW